MGMRPIGSVDAKILDAKYCEWCGAQLSSRSEIRKHVLFEVLAADYYLECTKDRETIVSIYFTDPRAGEILKSGVRRGGSAPQQVT
jgi:hypothetical protein